jgi:hypothetical protein
MEVQRAILTQILKAKLVKINKFVRIIKLELREIEKRIMTMIKIAII